jgi:N-methylhydantoinase B
VADLDPIAVEVHRRAVENIAKEMGIALVRTSGSPTVTDAKDFSTSLLDLEGRQLSVVAYVLFHAASAMLGTRALIDDLAARGETAQPGDGWLLNNPHYGGAQHQGDVGLIMPVFHAGEQVAWSFANVHVADVGGSGVSGFAPGAHSVYEEGILFSIVRAVREGRLEEPWERFIAANVRVPNPVLNDIRSMIAANNTAQAKLSELLDRVGLERHHEFCKANRELTENVLRGRIAAIPDGIYESVDWIEFDGHGPDLALEVRGRLEVAGGELRFGFSGDPQIEAFVNATDGAVYGCTMTALSTMLGYGDLPFDAGMWGPISIDLGKPGTVVNAVPPAPVSAAHAEAGHRVIRVVKSLLAQALALSDDPVLRGRVAAQSHEGAPTAGLAGVNQRGGPCVAWYMDPAVGVGGGAQSTMDGQDCYGHTPMAGCGMPDVETHEATDPVVFLWRKLAANTGGPGQYRGGQGIEQAFYVDYTNQLAGFASTICAQFPPRGFGGGFPAATSTFAAIHDTNVHDLLALGTQPLEGNLEGRQDELPNKVGRLVVARGDVFVTYSGGGGGLGDPLLRDPETVARDVSDGYVTAPHALAAYGVALAESGEADLDATAASRERIRRERLGGEPSKPLRPPASPGVAVRSTAGHGWECNHCGTELDTAAAGWRKRGTVLRETAAVGHLAELEMRVLPRRTGPSVVVREYFCPACAACLSVDVALDGVELKTPALA